MIITVKNERRSANGDAIEFFSLGARMIRRELRGFLPPALPLPCPLKDLCKGTIIVERCVNRVDG